MNYELAKQLKDAGFPQGDLEKMNVKLDSKDLGFYYVAYSIA